MCRNVYLQARFFVGVGVGARCANGSRRRAVFVPMVEQPLTFLVMPSYPIEPLIELLVADDPISIDVDRVKHRVDLGPLRVHLHQHDAAAKLGFVHSARLIGIPITEHLQHLLLVPEQCLLPRDRLLQLGHLR